MCKQCELNPVYEFTNKRKLCKNCFINYFHKKVLYTNRKFNLICRGDVIGYQKGNNINSVVLKEVLNLFESKGFIRLVLAPTNHPQPPTQDINKQLTKNSRLQMKLLIATNKLLAKRSKIYDKLAFSDNLDSEADRIIHELIEGSIKLNKTDKRIVKPLHLFSDREILIYAKIKRLKFIEKKIKKDNITLFVEDLEKKHPEIKRAIVNSYLGLSL